MKDGRLIVKEYRNADIFATIDIEFDTEFGFAKINIQFDPDASEQAQKEFMNTIHTTITGYQGKDGLIRGTNAETWRIL